LLHYRENAWGNVESQVDGPDFFVSPQGKTHPVLEWKADSAALFDTTLVGDARFSCRFPARARWMRQQLPKAPVPEAGTCPALETFKATLDADSVALVFASSYINSPPSAFGHVYLKLVRRGGRSTAGLADYTVGFGAQMEGAGPLKVVVAGFGGAFKGYYNVIPFDASVRRYSHHDNREQWIFPLALDAVETERLVEHLWELRHTYLYYAFLTENCAYHLATLLEASRLDLDLNRSPITTPLGLLHEVRASGIVQGGRELPSMRRRLAFEVDALSEGERQGLRALLESRYRPESVGEFSDTARARLYDLASLTMDYRYGTRWILDSVLHTRKLDLLQARASLPDYPSVVIPSGTPPTHSHKAGRIEAGTRYSRGGLSGPANDFAIYATAMPALQSLTDDVTGLSETAEFKVLEAAAEFHPETREARFERLTLLDLFNFQPSEALLRNLAWRTTLSLENGYAFQQQPGPFTADFLLGFGRAFSESARNRTILTLLVTGGSRWLFDAAEADPFAGFQGMGLWNAGARTRVALQAEVRTFARAGIRGDLGFQLQQNLTPEYGVILFAGSNGRIRSDARARLGLGGVAHW
jgi:hypothetical protein